MSEKTISLTNLARYKEDSDNLYAKQNGSYENMSVGNADNLTPYGANSGSNDTTPFVFQSSGGGSDIGSLAQLKELRGNTVKFNQLYRTETTSVSDGGITRTRDATTGIVSVSGTATGDFDFAIIPSAAQESLNSTHKYLYKWNFKGSINDNSLCFGNQIIIEGWNKYWDTDGIGLGRNVNTYLQCRILTGAIVDFTIQPQIFDLTEMFGAGNEPESVVEFNRLFTKTYYAYDSGSLLSCKSSKIVNVGYNAYDNSNPNDFIRVVSGQTYTLEGSGTVSLYDYDKNLLSDTFVSESALPNNCCFVKITGGDTTTCLHLTWDGSKTGYEPYKSQTFQLPNVELRSVGSVYDSITPDGTLTRRVGIVDLGTLSWTYNSSNNVWETSLPSNMASHSYDYSYIPNIIADNYETRSNGDVYINNVPNSITSSGAIRVYNGSSTTEPSGNLIYELETPITEQVSTFVENTSIDDWGTQEFISNESIVIPQGCDFFYVADYKAFIDSLGEREDINYDASKIVSSTELQTAMSGIDLSDYAKLDGTTTFTEVNFGDGAKINKDSSNRIDLQYNNDSRIKIGSANLNVKARIDPDSNNTYDLGRSGVAWKDLYLAGNISDGTNSVSIADVSNGLFNVINATDIVLNTLTQDQYDLITNGKMTLISGAFLGLSNAIYFTPQSNGTVWRGLIIGCETDTTTIIIKAYELNISTKVIIISTSKRIRTDIDQINGKSIPTYPASTGTFVLKCVDGVLTWVAE